MVVFSSVTLSKKLADSAIETALQEDSKLLMVEIRSRKVSRKVALMTEERGFMGKEVVDQLEREITRERLDHIDQRVKELESRAKEGGVETETIILERASIKKILEIAREKNASVIIAEKRLKKIGEGESVPFEMIRVKK
jgi:hypothetical protein